MEIKVNIECCEECPYAKVEKVYTPDSFEDVRKIHCNKLNKTVHIYLNLNEKSFVPNECPFNSEVVDVKEKYKVFYYFGIWNPNPFVKPSKEIIVEIKSGATEKEIISEGLKQVGTYPKTYTATVIKL